MGKVVFRIVLLLIIGSSFLIALGGCKEKEKKEIVIIKPTELLLKADRMDSRGNKTITILEKGSRCQLITIRYSKDFMFYKVKTKDGKKGYILYDDRYTQEISN